MPAKNPQTSRQCPFCGRSGVKFSREHFLPAEWGEYFPRAPILISAAHDYDGESTDKVENLSQFDKQFGGICRDCNSGWMREIDVEAKHVAIDLGYRRRRHVAADEVLPLSASLYRAALIGIWGQRDFFGFPEHRFSEFYKTRQPPHDVQILLGHNDGGYLYAGGNYSAVTVEGFDGAAVRSFAFGGVGHLFVVVIVSDLELPRAVREVVRGVKRTAQGTLVPLWPNRRRQGVTLPSHAITRDIAAHATEIGVAVGVRVDPVPRTPVSEKVQTKFADPEALRKAVRMPTKRIDW